MIRMKHLAYSTAVGLFCIFSSSLSFAQTGNETADQILEAGATALVGDSPPPLNVLGAALISLVFGGDEDPMDLMNEKLDSIQSSNEEILSNIRELRTDFRSALSDYGIEQEHINVLVGIASTVNFMSGDYRNNKDAHASPNELIHLVYPKHEELAAALLRFETVMTEQNVEDDWLMASDYVALAELHLMILQEWVQLTLDCNNDNEDICVGSDTRTEVVVNHYYDAIDRYTKYIQRLAVNAADYRANQIEFTRGVFSWSPENHPAQSSESAGIIDMAENRVLEEYYLGFGDDQDAKVEMYKNIAREKTQAQLNDSLYKIIRNMEQSKQRYAYMNTVRGPAVAQGCAALFSELDYQGDPFVVCNGEMNAQLSEPSTIRSVLLGQSTTVSLHEGIECDLAFENTFTRFGAQEEDDDSGNILGNGVWVTSYTVDSNDLSSVAQTGTAVRTFSGVTANSEDLYSSFGYIPNIRGCLSSTNNQSTTFVFAEPVSYRGKESGVLRAFFDNASLAVAFHEDQSLDDEQTHSWEHVDAIAVKGLSSPYFMETGEFSLDSSYELSLQRRYNNPVAIFQIVTFNGAEPVTVMLEAYDRNKNTMLVNLKEFAHRDNGHVEELVQYMVIEAGEYDLPNGQTLIAGTFPVETGFFGTNHVSVDYHSIPLTDYRLVAQLQKLTPSNQLDGVIDVRIREKQSTQFAASLVVQESDLDWDSGRIPAMYPITPFSQGEVGFVAVGNK